MAIASVSAATYPPPPPPPPTSYPPSSGTYNESTRVKFAHWMENTFGRAYLPITMAAGGLAGGVAGTMLLGPIGGIIGAGFGAMFAGALIFAD